MSAAISLNVLTHEGLAITDEAVSVIAPGGLGYVGMLRNHAPMVTTIKPGTLTWTRVDGTRRTIHVGEGLLEIVTNRLTILTTAVSDMPDADRVPR